MWIIIENFQIITGAQSFEYIEMFGKSLCTRNKWNSFHLNTLTMKQTKNKLRTKTVTENEEYFIIISYYVHLKWVKTIRTCVHELNEILKWFKCLIEVKTFFFHCCLKFNLWNKYFLWCQKKIQSQLPLQVVWLKHTSKTSDDLMN